MITLLALVVLYYAARNSSAGTRTDDDPDCTSPARRGHQFLNGWQYWDDSDIPMFEPFGSCTVETHAGHYLTDSAFTHGPSWE